MSKAKKKLLVDAGYYKNDPFSLLQITFMQSFSYLFIFFEIRIARFVAGIYYGENWK